MQNKGVISVGLWGSNPKYITGLLRMSYQVKHRLIAAEKIVCFISSDQLCELWSNNGWLELSERCFGSHIQFVSILGDQPGWHSTIWRYTLIRAILDCSAPKGIDYGCIIHFRDLDSIILPREEQVISSWIKSKLPYLIIKDHPSHDTWPIMAGLFSINTSQIERNELRNFWNILERSIPLEELYFSDQIALSYSYKEISHNKFHLYRGHANARVIERSVGYMGEPIGHDLSVDTLGRSTRAEYISRLAVE